METKFRTFAAEDDDRLNKMIQDWIKSINGKEVARSAPAIAFSPYMPQYEDGGRLVIAVTVTAEH